MKNQNAKTLGHRKPLLVVAILSTAISGSIHRAGAESSSNIVGYVDKNLPAGWCLIAQPFVTSDPSFSATFQAVPDTTTFYKWNTANANWDIYSYDLALGGWDPPGAVLNVGQGGFMVMPVAGQVTFTGDVPLGTWNWDYPAGFSLFSPPVTHPAVAFPAQPSVLLYTYVCGAGGGYNVITYDEEFGGWNPFVPSFALAEAALISLPSPRSWITTFAFVEPASPGWRLLPPVRIGQQLTLNWVAPPGAPAPPADVFYTPDLRSSAPWTNLGRSTSGQTQMQFSSFASPNGFFVLGTLRDTDGDGITDMQEVLVSQTNPRIWDLDPLGDADGDGIQNYRDARPFDPAVNWPVSITIVKPVNGTPIN